VIEQSLATTSDRIIAGTESVLRGMTTFQKRDWLLRSWRDVFVDLVQGQLQHLFLSLLSGKGFNTRHLPFQNVVVFSLLFVLNAKAVACLDRRSTGRQS
jgi:hypothetical protein